MTRESKDLPGRTDFKTEWWTPRLAWPVITAALVRLTLLSVALIRSGTSELIRSDTSIYLIPGRNLLLHGQFFADGVPDLLRTPGYSLFLALTIIPGITVASLANVILSVFSVVLVWRLARLVFGDEGIALGAAWIFAFEPNSALDSIGLAPETLFVLLLLLSLGKLAEFLRGHRPPALAVAGLGLAAAALVRPVGYYLPLALALGLLLVLARVPVLRWKAPAVLLVATMPWLAAWQVRNWVDTGYSGFCSISDENLYFLPATFITARLEHRPPREVSEEAGYGDFTGNAGQSYLYQPYLALHPEQVGWGQAQRLAFMHSTAIAIIRAHPGIYLRSCVEDLFMTVFRPVVYKLATLLPEALGRAAGPKPGGVAPWRFALARIHATSWALVERIVFEIAELGLYLLAMWAILLAVRGAFRDRLNNACLLLLLGTSIYFLAVTAATTGGLPLPRLRTPVMPVVCILAAAGLQCATGKKQSPSTRLSDIQRQQS